jgi:hypothetical protein
VSVNPKKALILVGTLALVIAVVLLIAKVKSSSNKEKPTSPSPVAASATRAASLSLGSDQNDHDGYDGRQWGSTSTDGLHGVETQWDPTVEKVIGPPGEVVNESFLPDTDTAPTVQVLHRDSGDQQEDNDTEFGFYNNQLAWVSVKMNGTYADVKRMLDGKYSESEDVTPGYFGEGDLSPAMWEGFNFNGKLYRRGKTNTRIYLLGMADQDGNQQGLWMLYIPTAYVIEMRQAWWGAYQHEQRAKADKDKEREDEVRKVDQDKVQ